jgi:hypothetical protein
MTDDELPADEAEVERLLECLGGGGLLPRSLGRRPHRPVSVAAPVPGQARQR